MERQEKIEKIKRMVRNIASAEYSMLKCIAEKNHRAPEWESICKRAWQELNKYLEENI